MGAVRALRAMGLVVALGAAPAFAGGLEVEEQDVELMGAAFAGRAAVSFNASAAWWNPAALSRLPKGWNYNVGVHVLLIDSRFSDAGSTDATGGQMLGDPNVNSGKAGVVPNLYVARSIGERWVAGLAVNVPFGLANEYPTNSTVRYFATLSELRVINVLPAVSYRLTEQWSIGVGLSIQHADATLANQIDFGSIGAAQSIPGLVPQMNDGSVDISGDSVAFGFTVGVHFELDDQHKFGLSYRGRIVHDIDGMADFTVPAAAQPIIVGSGAFVDTGVQTRLTLPDRLILSGSHQVAERWTVLWDVTWTDWSRLPFIQIDFDNPNQPPSILDLQWDDAWRFSVGGVFAATDQWTFRGGIAWDESPVPDSTRGPRLPDADRLWIAFGVSYRIKDSVILHLAYFHIFTDRVGVTDSGAASGNLVGSAQGSTDAISIGITGNF